jgi:anaerobic selenocysteine-containing dehydrogenase
MHPADAAARGLSDGEQARIFNDRGTIQLEVLFDSSLPLGVVAARLDWAKLNVAAPT